MILPRNAAASEKGHSNAPGRVMPEKAAQSEHVQPEERLQRMAPYGARRWKTGSLPFQEIVSIASFSTATWPVATFKNNRGTMSPAAKRGPAGNVILSKQQWLIIISVNMLGPFSTDSYIPNLPQMSAEFACST